MKVYVVMFIDDEKEARVWGVFSTREKADTQRETHFGYHGWILEHELDR